MISDWFQICNTDWVNIQFCHHAVRKSWLLSSQIPRQPELWISHLYSGDIFHRHQPDSKQSQTCSTGWVDIHLHHHAMRMSWLLSFRMAGQPEHRLFGFLPIKATLCSAYSKAFTHCYAHLWSTAALDNMQLMKTFVAALHLRYRIFNEISAARGNLWWLFLKLKRSHLRFYDGSRIGVVR